MRPMRVWRAATIAIALVLALAATVRAGSSEPKLALAEALATVESGVVSVDVVSNFDYANALRLGYPVAVVVTQGVTTARMYLDGSVTVEISNPWPTGSTSTSPPAGPGAPGIVAIAPDRLSAVLPPVFAAGALATVHLEAAFSYQGNQYPVRSNSVEVHW